MTDAINYKGHFVDARPPPVRDQQVSIARLFLNRDTILEAWLGPKGDILDSKNFQFIPHETINSISVSGRLVIIASGDQATSKFHVFDALTAKAGEKFAADLIAHISIHEKQIPPVYTNDSTA